MALLIDHAPAAHHGARAAAVPRHRAGAAGARAGRGARGRAAAAPTLDDLLTGTWGRLTAGVATACPVCAGELAPRWSAGAGIVGGRCTRLRQRAELSEPRRPRAARGGPGAPRARLG